MGNPGALSTSGGVTRRRIFGISTNHGDPSASERDTPADDLTNHPERHGPLQADVTHFVPGYGRIYIGTSTTVACVCAHAALNLVESAETVTVSLYIYQNLQKY